MDDNNESKESKKIMKKDFNKLGLTLLMQGLIPFVVMFIFMLSIGIIMGIAIKLLNINVSQLQLTELFKQPNILGLISIVGVIIGFIPVLFYRKKEFFSYDIKVENKKITLKSIIIGFIVLIAVNNLLVLFANVLEFGINQIGLSASSALENLDVLNKPGVLMLIYVCIIGPVFEEFLYRGAVLRGLEKYGKRFAILVSAILFGLMHGNFYQIFMAAGLGIILGYLATEYSIKLTILLHILNNIFVQVTSQITFDISENIGNIIDKSIICMSAIILVVVFIINKNKIKEWLQNNRMEKGIMLRFFTSILVVLVVVYDLAMVISAISIIS